MVLSEDPDVSHKFQHPDMAGTVTPGPSTVSEERLLLRHPIFHPTWCPPSVQGPAQRPVQQWPEAVWGAGANLLTHPNQANPRGAVAALLGQEDKTPILHAPRVMQILPLPAQTVHPPCLGGKSCPEPILALSSRPHILPTHRAPWASLDLP